MLRLRDGRELAWTERGNPEGDPVIEFHGNPGCRLGGWGDDGVLAASGTRLISFDRPGIGGSSAAPTRSPLDSASDPIELADSLGLGGFAVLGYSLGGAYAAACAAAAPERVSALALVSSVVPLGELSELGHERQWRAAERWPRALALTYRTLAATTRWAPRITDRVIAAGLSAPDRAVASRPEVRERLRVTAIEAGAQGGRGTVEDMRAAMRPWGFGLDQVRCPTTIWQGDADGSIPVAWAERLAAAIEGAELRLLRGEGHYLIEDRLGEILASLGE